MILTDRGVAGRPFESAARHDSGRFCQNRGLFLSTTALCGLMAAGLVGVPGAARAADVNETVTTAQTGIGYSVSGSDTIDITTTASATMTGASYGIQTSAADGATTIKVGGAVSSSVTGISANASGLGDIAINTATGVTVTGLGNNGILAGSQGGAVNIGGVAGLGGAVSGLNGIYASTTGAGTIVIKTASGGTVTGTSNTGISTAAGAGATTINLGANVSSSSVGINAFASGAGDIAIETATGVTVTGGSNFGIRVFSQGGAVDIGGAAGLGGAVSGGSAGLYASTTGAGTISIKTASGGTVTSTGSDGISTVAATGSTTIDLGANVSGSSFGVIAYASGAGDIAITTATGVTVSGSAGNGISAESRGGAIDIGGTAGLGGAVSGNIAIRVQTSGSGTIGVRTAAGVAITGTYFGIDASAENGATAIDVRGAVSGSDTGIKANASGSGGIAITTATGVTVSARNGDGISAASQGGAIDIGGAAGLGGAVSGGFIGLYAFTTGSGAINIKTASAGTVTATSGSGIVTSAVAGSTTMNLGANVSGNTSGIDATASGAGDIAIKTATGVTVSGSGNYGIYARSAGGAVDIGGAAGLGGAVSGKNAAISARTTGGGTIGIKTAAGVAITSTNDVGISASADSGATNIDVGGAVSGSTFGIYASASSLGDITIKTATGVTVSSASSAGIAASGKGGAVNIGGANGLGGAVSGYYGINARNTVTGTISIKTLADVTGTGSDGIWTAAEDGATSISIGSGATVTGGNRSSAIRAATKDGNVTIANFGTVRGPIQGVESSSGAGTGTFTFNNSGTFILTGLQANTGFAINNLSGGVLTGDSAGSFGDVNAASGSIIRPGDRTLPPIDGAPAMGTLRTGNLTLASGAIVEVRADYSGYNDKVAVTGNAVLGGATLKVLATPQIDATWATSKTFEVLTATGTITGTFASVTTDYAFLKFTADYTTTGVVKVTGDRNWTSFQPYAKSTNQKSVASVFDAFQTSSSPLIAKVTTLTTGGAPVALNQLSGTGVTTARTQAFDAVGVFSSTVFSEMGRFTASAGGGAGPLSYVEDKGLKTKAFDKLAPKAQPIADSRVWAHMLGAIGNMKADAATATPSERSTNYGLAAGADTALTPNLRAGFALAGGQSVSKVAEAATKSDATWGQGSAYAVATDGARYAKASLTYGYIASETERTVTAFAAPEKATGKFGANLYSARLEVGQKFDTAPVGVTPFAAFEPSWLMQKGYSETAATIGLTYGASVSRAMPATLGVTFDTAFDLADMRVAPSATFGWVHNFTSSASISPFFTALPGSNFTVQGAKGDRDLARIDLNVEATPNGSLASFYINARADLGARTNAVRGMAGAMLRF